VCGFARWPTMRKLDYAIGSFGIFSTIAVLGFLGEIAFGLVGYFLWFLNFFICVVSIGILIFKGFVKVLSLFPSRQMATSSPSSGYRRYVLYTFTNSLPMLAMVLMVRFDLKPWWNW